MWGFNRQRVSRGPIIIVCLDYLNRGPRHYLGAQICKGHFRNAQLLSAEIVNDYREHCIGTAS